MVIIHNSRAYGDMELIIDEDDIPIYNSRRWTASKMGSTYYFHGKDGDARAYLHRLIMKAPKDKMVDHKDRNGLNLSKSNLRIATRQQNNQNSTVKKTNKTGFKGVFITKYGTFRATLKHNGKRVPLGCHKTPEIAAEVRDRKALELLGEFAWLNFANR